MCPRLKVLRIEENCLPLAAFTPRIFRESPVSLLAVDGNVFDMKSFQALDGYDQVFSILLCHVYELLHMHVVIAIPWWKCIVFCQMVFTTYSKMAQKCQRHSIWGLRICSCFLCIMNIFVNPISFYVTWLHQHGLLKMCILLAPMPHVGP